MKREEEAVNLETALRNLTFRSAREHSKLEPGKKICLICCNNGSIRIEKEDSTGYLLYVPVNQIHIAKKILECNPEKSDSNDQIFSNVGSDEMFDFILAVTIPSLMKSQEAANISIISNEYAVILGIYGDMYNCVIPNQYVSTVLPMLTEIIDSSDLILKYTFWGLVINLNMSTNITKSIIKELF
jgi:hypothetical protein